MSKIEVGRIGTFKEVTDTFEAVNFSVSENLSLAITGIIKNENGSFAKYETIAVYPPGCWTFVKRLTS